MPRVVASVLQATGAVRYWIAVFACRAYQRVFGGGLVKETCVSSHVLYFVRYLREKSGSTPAVSHKRKGVEEHAYSGFKFFSVTNAPSNCSALV